MKDSVSDKSKKNALAIFVGIIGGLIVISVFAVGTIIMGGAANTDTGKAVHSVSCFSRHPKCTCDKETDAI